MALAGIYRLKSARLCSRIAASAPAHATAKYRASESANFTAPRTASLTTENASTAAIKVDYGKYEYFWLCADCAPKMSLKVEWGKGVVVVPASAGHEPH